MSVDVKDYRRSQAAKELTIPSNEPLVEQAESKVNTGDVRLDKLGRMVESEKQKAEAQINVVASTGMGAVQEEMFRLKQFEYFYEKGKVDAFNLVQTFPDQIIMEEKTR